MGIIVDFDGEENSLVFEAQEKVVSQGAGLTVA